MRPERVVRSNRLLDQIRALRFHAGWHVGMQSSPAALGCAWPHLVPVDCTCLTVCMTRSLTGSRSWHTGMPYHDLIGTHTQQDVELDKVFMDVAQYSVRVMGPTHVENIAHLACRTALLPRRDAHHVSRGPSGSRG